MELLDKDNNPLSHAKYHQEKVREAGERERRPLPLDIPKYLEQSMREYLTQVGRGTKRMGGVWSVFALFIHLHLLAKVCIHSFST